MLAVSAASLAGGFTLNRMLAAIVVVVMLGAVMTTLWWADHRIKEAPLDRSLREALMISDRRWMPGVARMSPSM